MLAAETTVARNGRIRNHYTWFNQRTQKQWFVLVHACISKEQCRIVDRNARTARPKSMLVLFNKEIYKGLADLGHGPFQVLTLLSHVVTMDIFGSGHDFNLTT